MFFFFLSGQDFVVRLETNHSIGAQRFAQLLFDIDTLARAKDVELQIAEIGSGSFWVRFRSDLGLAADIIALATFASFLVTSLQQGNSEFADTIADLVDNDAVVSVQVITDDQTITIAANDMPAVERRRLSADPPSAPHKLHASPLTTAPPEIGTPSLQQNLRAGIGDTDEARGRASEVKQPVDKPSTFVGSLSEGRDGLEFHLRSGATALVDSVETDEGVPKDQLIEIDAFLRRGERGGMADPRLTIIAWRPKFRGDDDVEFGPEVERTVFDQWVRNNLGGQVKIPLQYKAPGSQRSVNWIGEFQESDAGLIMFRREDGKVFEVLGPDPRIELPLGQRLHVSGSVGHGQSDPTTFYPNAMRRIDER